MPPLQRPAVAITSGRCYGWATTSTPALLVRMLCTRRLNVLCIAFVCGLGGLNGGAISIVFYGQRCVNTCQACVNTCQACMDPVRGHAASAPVTFAFAHAACLARLLQPVMHASAANTSATACTHALDMSKTSLLTAAHVAWTCARADTLVGSSRPSEISSAPSPS